MSAGKGAPGTAFGVLEVTRNRTERRRTCSDAGLAWLRGELLGGQPPRTDIWFGVRGERGQQRGQILNFFNRINHTIREQDGKVW
ncbi:hypothetical protein ACFPIJ_47410 [Dactylosporangium cerinum]|uniref:Transposase n=1 Tax=Dactylosporangium cerinum TaxID=1434730 RepID=A0ABV9WDD9_9ACTN